LGGACLEEIAQGSGPKSVVHGVVVFCDGQDNDVNLFLFLKELTCELDPAHPRHVYICQKDVRRIGKADVQGFLPIATDRDQLAFGHQMKGLLQSIAIGLLIIGNYDSNLWRHGAIIECWFAGLLDCWIADCVQLVELDELACFAIYNL
jgi:hypothetical protein